MNILLINQYAGSVHHGMEYRPFYLAREWTRMGHKVTIVASSVSHVRTVAPTAHGALTQEILDGIAYNWLSTPTYQHNGVKRALNILAFVLQLFRFSAHWIKELKPDLVITSSTHPLDNFPGNWIARRAGAKLIYEVHDLWPLSLIELGGMSPKHPFVQLLQWGENYAYNNVDYVVSLLPNALEYMRAHGLASEKFVHVPNGIDTTEWSEQKTPLSVEHQQTIEEARNNFKLLICYAGAHGVANALDTVLEAAHLLHDKAVCFLLVGNGPEKARLISRCSQERIKNVLFLPSVQKASIPSLFAAVDVLYIGLKREPLFRFGVSPNKLIDYMMAGKPILYAVGSGNNPVLDADCGLSVPPENPEALAQAVDRMLTTPLSKLAEMGNRGQVYCLKNHDYRKLASKFLNSIA